MKWPDLATPALLIDLERLEANAERMLERCRRLGVQLRPHVKTHKCLEAARIQCGGRPGPITVSTVAEAEFFAAGGFTDITYAVPVGSDKLDRLAALQHAGVGLQLLLDHPRTLKACEEFCRAHDARFPALLKVDCGYHRAGVLPGDSESVSLARRMDESKWLDFEGLAAHGGQSYDAIDAAGIRQAAVQERDATVGFARTLRAAGIRVSTVSVGSTPTIHHVDHLDGVTEVRPGNYLLLDRFQAAIGTAPLEDCAISVSAQIIGLYPHRGELIVDAGALAMSKDPGARHVSGFGGYGAVLGDDALQLASISQEHGVVEARAGADWSRLRIGRRLRIVPNHSCLTAALFPSYSAVRGEEVTDTWRPVRGW